MSPYPHLARAPIALVSRRTRLLLTTRHLLVGQLLPIGLLLLAGLLLLMGCQPERSAPSTYGTAEVQEAAEAAATSEKASTRKGGGQAAPLDAVGHQSTPLRAVSKEDTVSFGFDVEAVEPAAAQRWIEKREVFPLCPLIESVRVVPNSEVPPNHFVGKRPAGYYLDVHAPWLSAPLTFAGVMYEPRAPRSNTQEAWNRVTASSWLAFEPKYRYRQGCGQLREYVEGVVQQEFFVDLYVLESHFLLLLRDQDGTVQVALRRPNTKFHVPRPSESAGYSAPSTSSMQLKRVNSDYWIGRIPLADAEMLEVRLSTVIRYGEWRTTDESVTYGTDYRVLIYTCDPYSASHEHCGFETEDGVLLADPPSPIEIHIAYRFDEEKKGLEFLPFQYAYPSTGLLEDASEMKKGQPTYVPVTRH
jgi:hypothetical protein